MMNAIKTLDRCFEGKTRKIQVGKGGREMKVGGGGG